MGPRRSKGKAVISGRTAALSARQQQTQQNVPGGALLMPRPGNLLRPHLAVTQLEAQLGAPPLRPTLRPPSAVLRWLFPALLFLHHSHKTSLNIHQQGFHELEDLPHLVPRVPYKLSACSYSEHLSRLQYHEGFLHTPTPQSPREVTWSCRPIAAPQKQTDVWKHHLWRCQGFGQLCPGSTPPGCPAPRCSQTPPRCHRGDAPGCLPVPCPAHSSSPGWRPALPSHLHTPPPPPLYLHSSLFNLKTGMWKAQGSVSAQLS